MGDPSTEDRPQVFAGVLLIGMTSSRADTLLDPESSIICRSTTLKGPMLARFV